MAWILLIFVTIIFISKKFSYLSPSFLLKSSISPFISSMFGFGFCKDFRLKSFIWFKYIIYIIYIHIYIYIFNIFIYTYIKINNNFSSLAFWADHLYLWDKAAKYEDKHLFLDWSLFLWWRGPACNNFAIIYIKSSRLVPCLSSGDMTTVYFVCW